MKEIIKDFKAEAILEVKYYPESQEFVEAFKSYKDCCDHSADVDDMLKQIVFEIVRFGTDTFIEGVGVVSINGKKQGDPEDWCGVDISTDYIDFDVDEY